MRVRRLFSAALPLLLALACTDSQAPPREVVEFTIPTNLDAYRPFLDIPFPSDIDVRADGTRIVQSFPNPTEATVLEEYRVELERGRGWALNGAVFLRFSAALDVSAFPDPAGTLQSDAVVQLVDVDASSPERGRRIPVRLHFEAAGSAYFPSNTLVALPVLGFPLRPSTTYALVVTMGLRTASGAIPVPSSDLVALLNAAAPADPRLVEPHRAFAPLRDATDLGLDPRGIAHATVFTTTEVLGAFNRARDRVVAGAPYPVANWSRREDHPTYILFEGTIDLPQFPRGNAPWDLYDGVSGSWELDATGTPIVQGTERVKFALSVPNRAAPTGGWPVFVVGHGTGGSYETFIGDGIGDEATWMAAAGCAAIGISQPIHFSRAGYHAGVEELNTFNFLNPHGAKGIWRQAALESIAVMHSLAAFKIPVDFTGGVEVPLNKDYHLYFGHSQGGITGALMAGVEKDLHMAILSGAGGGFAESLLEKTEPLVIADAVRLVLGLPDEEPLSEFHPILTYLQLMGEELEPLNVFGHAYDEGHRPPHLLVYSGQTDAHTPPRTHGPLAAVAGLPLINPVIAAVPALDLRGIGSLPGPISGNIQAPGQRTATGALAQFGGNHFTIYNDFRAANMARDFAISFLAGGVRINR